MSESESSNSNIKIVRDEKGKIIKTAEGTLCEYVDSDGNTTLKFIETTNSSISLAVQSESMPSCSTAFNKGASTGGENSSHGVLWTANESKELLQLYYENIGQIGPFSTFKNKKRMWEFISNEITKKHGTFRSSLQCEYRYKNMLQRRNVAKKRNRRSGSEKCNIDFEEEFELISSIDDSIEPDICFGIGQHTIKKRKIDCLSSEEEAEIKTKTFPNIFKVLQNINNEKEIQKERRHKEKIEVFRELFSNNFNK